MGKNQDGRKRKRRRVERSVRAATAKEGNRSPPVSTGVRTRWQEKERKQQRPGVRVAGKPSQSSGQSGEQAASSCPNHIEHKLLKRGVTVIMTR